VLRRLVVLVCLIAGTTGVAGAAAAAYPDKPIRFVIPSAPGGSPDVLMRVLLAELSKQMGVAIVVENKPGASFVIGTMDVVRAPADGYTLGYGNIVSLAINRSLLEKVPYDAERELTLISNCIRVYNTLAVVPRLPTVAEAGVPGYETIAWGGIIGPAGLPKDIVARLVAEIRAAYASPVVQERYRNLDTEIDGGTPEQFLELVRSETPKWAAVVKRSGAKVD
jgi:tripartite-type tricarboxylate transporter receptor subunit TctC